MPRRPTLLVPRSLTLPEAVALVAQELCHIAQALQSPGADTGSITKQDLLALEERLTMKLSEAKTLIAQAASRSTEAFAELGTKIAEMQTQIDDLVSGNGDPDVTDEAFTADLATLKQNVDALADIVPGPEVPPVDPVE